MRLLPLAFVTVILGQPLVPYRGDWTAEFHGTIYIHLALNDKAGTPEGAMSICTSIQVDGQGSVDRQLAAEGIRLPKPFRLTRSR